MRQTASIEILIHSLFGRYRPREDDCKFMIIKEIVVSLRPLRQQVADALATGRSGGQPAQNPTRRNVAVKILQRRPEINATAVVLPESASEQPDGIKESFAMGKPVVHFEIGCRDQQKTSEFYKTMFDWSIEQMGPAAMINTGAPGGIPGHITALGHEPFHYTMFYVDVDDVAAYLAKAESLGGKTIVPPVPLPTGTFAWFSDPDGNTIGLWQAKA